MKVRYPKNVPLLKVETPVLNGRYHVAWGRSRGVIGICTTINHFNRTVKLKSPTTGIIWNTDVKWDDLRHTRKTQFKIENNQL